MSASLVGVEVEVEVEPLIQHCTCGGRGFIKSRFGVFGSLEGREKWVRCSTCGHCGPRRPSKVPAIEAWNSEVAPLS